MQGNPWLSTRTPALWNNPVLLARLSVVPVPVPSPPPPVPPPHLYTGSSIPLKAITCGRRQKRPEGPPRVRELAPSQRARQEQ